MQVQGFGFIYQGQIFFLSCTKKEDPRSQKVVLPKKTHSRFSVLLLERCSNKNLMIRNA